MIVAVSPYHLTTREPPALASLLLADRVVTLLPSAPDDADTDRQSRFEQAVRTIPRYHALLDSWRWAEALWHEGVVAPALDGHDPIQEVHAALTALSAGSHPELIPVIEQGLEHDAWALLGAVAKDLLRGGPDPAVSLPVAAGLDAFAARHDILSARASASSIAQKIEESYATRLLSIAVPILAQAEGDRLLEARDRLAEPLARLRLAVIDALNEVADPAAARDAAHAYAAAFDEHRDDLCRCDDPLDARVIPRTVRISIVSLPADCVLRSAAEAARRLRMARGAPAPGLVPAARVLGMVVHAID